MHGHRANHAGVGYIDGPARPAPRSSAAAGGGWRGAATLPKHGGARPSPRLGLEHVIAELLTFFALLSLAVTALVVLIPGAVRARAWLALPLGAIAAAAAAAALLQLTGDYSAAEFLLVWALLMGIVARVL